MMAVSSVAAPVGEGRKVGTKRPDAVKAVEWKDVALEKGLNEIAVEAGGRRDVHLITKTEME